MCIRDLCYVPAKIRDIEYNYYLLNIRMYVRIYLTNFRSQMLTRVKYSQLATYVRSYAVKNTECPCNYVRIYIATY